MGVLEQPKIKDFNNVSDVFQGGVAKWPNAFDCKSNLNVVRTFESCLLHKIAHLNNVQVEIKGVAFRPQIEDFGCSGGGTGAAWIVSVGAAEK